MYFLWHIEITSCGIIGMKHALPVLDSGQSLRSPSSLYTPLWWVLALGEGESLGRMGLGFNMEDSKEKKKYCQGHLHPNMPSMNLSSQARMGDEASENE